MPEFDPQYGAPTGRVFIYDDFNMKIVATEPEHGEWHRWIENIDTDGDLWYISDDSDGYILDAEEFGPIEEPEPEPVGRFKNYMTGELSDDAVEDRKGSWYIKPGFAGFNSTTNNGWGYVSKAFAERAILRFQSRGQR